MRALTPTTLALAAGLCAVPACARPAHTAHAAHLAPHAAHAAARRTARVSAHPTPHNSAKPTKSTLHRAVASRRHAASVNLVHAHHDRRQHHEPENVVSVLRHTGSLPQLPTIEDQAITPAVINVQYRHGHLVMPAALKGSRDILIHQNLMADADGLARIQDDDDLLRLRNAHALVPIPAASGVATDDRLPPNRRYTRPWTAQFLTDMGRAHYARFHTPIQVNSAVRTVDFQQHLLHINGNAAPIDGDTASPHLTGQAVDLAKKGLSMTEIAWMRGYLLPLVQEGKVDVEEEFQQACFHISVYRKYIPQPAPRVIARPATPATSLAAAIR